MVVDDFVKFGLKLRLKSAQTLNKAFAEIVYLGRQNFLKPMMEENVNKTSKCLLKLRQLKFDSKENYKEAVFAERFSRTIRYVLELSGFDERNANWTEVLFNFAKKFNNTASSKIKLTPAEDLPKQDEKEILENLKCKKF